MNTLWKTVRNTSLETRALTLVALVIIALSLIVFCWLKDNFPVPDDEAMRILYLEHYVAVVQVIVVGVFVGLVSVILPVMLPNARDRFERYKQSRLAYSRAKTAVLYLADRVINVDEEKAFILVEEAHRELHFAETFEDVIISKGYLKWFDRPDLWIAYNYWQITAVATVLRISEYSNSHNKDILKRHLHDALKVVHKHFGKRGEECDQMKWNLKDGSRFEEEDRLEENIKAALK